jgi:hypothetical protein
MRLFPSDWLGFLDELAAWGDLSIPARRTFLDAITPGLSLSPARGEPSIGELHDAGLLVESGTAGHFEVAPALAGFHQVMKSLQKHPLFETPGLAVLCSYLGEHYSLQERSQLHESLALLPSDLPRIAGFVSSLEWLQEALGRPSRSSETAELATARTMLSFFTEQRDRVPMRDLEEYFPGIPRLELCAGARLGLQRSVFFLGLRRTDLEPLIGIWPAAARRLRRLSVVLAPEPVSVTQGFHHPFLVEDMTTLLMAARVQPIPMRRGDDKPFARFVEETCAMLLSLPEWMETFTGLSLEGRVGLALQALRVSGLLAAEDKGSGVLLTPSAYSAQWMHLPLAERLAGVVRVLAAEPGAPSRLFDLMEEEWTSSEGAREEIRPWLVQAFSFVPVSTFIRFADFAEYQAAIGSPLSAAGTPAQAAAARHDQPLSAGTSLATEEAIEELWKSFLGIFLGRCLLALGGAEAGLTADRRPAFRMSDGGRRLLGLPREGVSEREEPSAGAPAELIVQPNFEIVFLSPSAGAEAEIGRFSERIGREVGVLFRLTRQSLQRAAAGGLDANAVLDALARGSKSVLPANVEHEIRGWMDGPPG